MQASSPPSLGIIGVGQLADYCLAGMRRGGDQRRVVLSPHNRANAQALAEKYGCEIADSNQATVEQADVVLLSTRPENTPQALSDLTLHADQLLISVVAGVPLDVLVPLAAPATVVRSLPVCSAEVGIGGMPLYPDSSKARALLGTLGEIVAMDDEISFDKIAVIGCAIGWFFQLFAELQDWMVSTGIPLEQARAMALHSAHGASGLALAKPQMGLSELANTIARPGTYTLAGMQVLRERGGLRAMHAACDEVQRRFDEAGAP